MFKQNYNVIGVMSGTSLDGVDLAHVMFAVKDNKWSFKILEAKTIPYDSAWLNKLKVAVDFSEENLLKLDESYTNFLGNTVVAFIEKYKIKELDAVCSHGHTILHQPQNGFTLQIGNRSEIAKITNQNVVCDFRVQDVALGGQGAPLVPIGDRLLFSDYDYCLNLGGFSNISFEENKERIAFDICPVNTVLNFYANQFRLNYDDKGKIAKTGIINKDLLNKLNSIAFYEKKYPKSLGFEFVKQIILPLIESHLLAIEDKLSTFTEHIAIQIAKALPQKNAVLFVTGGGAYNDFLLQRIQFHLPKTKIIVPENTILEYKEALIFGLLGVLRMRNEVNVLSSVTGAKTNHSSGILFNK